MKIAITEEHYRELATNPDQAEKAVRAAVKVAEDNHAPATPPPRSIQDIMTATQLMYDEQMKKLLVDVRRILEKR
jgi:hypothetical protein